MRLSEIEEAFALGKYTPALMEQFRTARTFLKKIKRQLP